MTNHFDFAEAVIAWFDLHGRKSLPWQQNKSRYSVWISEIMLQQTQVKTVIPYYQRFMQRFENVVDLADADVDEVLHLWTGLGYYARARNMHKAAQKIRDEHGGVFPSDFEQVIALPGIGRSTAAAILSLADNKPFVIMDGNVKRVLSRFYAIEGWPGQPKIEKSLWARAQSLKPASRYDAYTQAMMDLGATLCTRSKPDCDRCPVQSHCLAFAQGRQQELPHKKTKKALPTKRTDLLIVFYQGSILLEKRPATGIWGGLFGLPESEPGEATDKFKSLGFEESATIKELEGFRHTFSHFHLDITPTLIEVSGKPKRVGESNHIWYSLTEPQDVGLAAPTVKIINHLNTIY